MSKSLIIKALKYKDRFPSGKGNINLEQLFQLSSTELDTMYRTVEGTLHSSTGLLGTNKDTKQQRALALIKMAFDEVQKAKASAEKAQANKVMKERIANVLADKDIESLQGLSKKKLEALYQTL